jgi:hypothetical protein
MTWRVPAKLPAAKLAGVVLLPLVVLLIRPDDPVVWTLAGVCAAALAAWAIRDLVVPVRLAADPSGVTVVTGFAGRRRLAWSQIERVRVDRRQRIGLSSAMLELDTGSTLHLFSQYDLGTAPEQVAETLAVLRSGATP